MSVSQKLCSLGLAGAMTLVSTAAAVAQKDATVVAEVDGVKLTVTDLEREEAAKLLQARYQYYQAQSRALEDLIERKLLEQKATNENLTIDQLVDRDVKAQVKDPTEDQMRVYYEGLETDQSYEAVRGKILEKIRQVRLDKARSTYLNSLRERASVVVELAPPTVNVSIENANTRGSSLAPVTLVEFADYECPYCQKVAPAIKQLENEFGEKLSVTYKDFPLPMHAHAEKAAEAARCAGKEGKFWVFHDQLFENKDLDLIQLKQHAAALKLDLAQFSKCLDSGEQAVAVQQDRAEGIRLGLSGTPSFFINGHFLSGALDYASLRRIIEQQLAERSRQAAISAKK